MIARSPGCREALKLSITWDLDAQHRDDDPHSPWVEHQRAALPKGTDLSDSRADLDHVECRVPADQTTSNRYSEDITVALMNESAR